MDVLDDGAAQVARDARASGVHLDDSPAAEQGYLPPLAEGFARFLEHGRISGLVRDEITRELESPREDAYDSHPPLAHRVAALREMPETTDPVDERPAIALLSDVAQVERDLCGFVMGRRAAAELKSIEWEQITEQVYVPQWRRVRDESREALAGCVADAPPASATALRDLGKRLLAPRVPPSPDVAIGYAHHALGCALATLLVERGLAPECGIGESIAFTRGDARIEPFGDLQRLASRELDADTWRLTCERFGIAGRALA